MTRTEPFWIVTGEPNGANRVTVAHESEVLARIEAERLAKQEKHTFYVCQSVAAVGPASPPVEWTEYVSQDSEG